MKTIKFVIFISLLLICKVYSQNPEWVVFNTENSILPTNNVTSIVVDSNNVVWIGTDGFLVSYNKGQWKYHKSIMGAKNLFVDKSNYLWIRNDILLKYDGKTVKRYEIDNNVPLPALLVDNNLNPWFSYDMSLAKIDNDSLKEWKIFEGIYQKYGITEPFYTIAIDSNNVIWAGTDDANHDGGAGIINIFNDSIGAYSNKVYDYNGGRIWEICVDRQNRKWLATDNLGLRMFYDTNDIYKIPNAPPMEFAGIDIDKDNNLWITSLRYGHLYKFDGEEFYHFKYSTDPLFPRSSPVIAIDSSGNKWIGTSDGIMVFREGGVILDVPNQQSHNKLLINCYPNPIKDKLQIDLSGMNGLLINIKLFDLYGRKLATLFNGIPDSTTTISFSTSYLPQGTYLILLRNGTQVLSKRIAVIK